jgi:signal transduction histidine kinase
MSYSYWLLTFIALFTRCNLFHAVESLELKFIIYTARAIFYLANFIFFLVYAAHLFEYVGLSSNRNGSFYKFSNYVINMSCYGQIEGIFLCCKVFSVGLFLIGRVIAGPCPHHLTIWNYHHCNPMADHDSIPFDMAFITLWLPFIGHMLCVCASKPFLFGCTLFSSFCVCFSALYVGNAAEFCWYLLCTCIVLSLTHELEHVRMREYVSYKLQLQSEIDKMESEKQKREAKERESKLLVSVVGNMAHDLKTPLQSFCMAVESLQRTIGRNLPGDLEMTKDLFDTIKATASFMEMAINRSMDFTKAAGDVALKAKYEVVDLVGAISWATTCVTDASNNVTTFTATLHPIPQDVCRHVITDMHWLKENVLCFLSNAAKYSDYRPVDVFVSVTRDALADEDSLFLRVAVQDSGVGIPDNVKEVLFQPFKQVQRLAGGTGLGLYSLRMRTKALGGTCGVRNRSDGAPGSLFWFEIPYRPDHAAAEDIKSCDVEVVRRFSDLPARSHKHVLIVEDTVVVCKGISKSLVEVGYTVETRFNGMTGMESAYDTSITGVTLSHVLSIAYLLSGLDRLMDKSLPVFDVVLVDFQMPVLDGPSMVQRYVQYCNQQQEEVVVEEKYSQWQSLLYDEDEDKSNAGSALHRPLIIGRWYI